MGRPLDKHTGEQHVVVGNGHEVCKLVTRLEPRQRGSAHPASAGRIDWAVGKGPKGKINADKLRDKLEQREAQIVDRVQHNIREHVKTDLGIYDMTLGRPHTMFLEPPHIWSTLDGDNDTQEWGAASSGPSLLEVNRGAQGREGPEVQKSAICSDIGVGGLGVFQEVAQAHLWPEARSAGLRPEQGRSGLEFGRRYVFLSPMLAAERFHEPRGGHVFLHIV